MMAGIYYGATYGNSISAVLIGIPGDSAAVVTALEGYKLARKGRAGHALTVSAVSSFAAYALERSVSKRPKEFGSGLIEGVSAAEAGNSGASIGAMVPLLALGIPGSGSTAIMLGGFLIWGLQPGPMLFQTNPDFVWGLIASMSIGNLMLLFMNIFLVPLFAQILRIRYTILATLIIVFCSAGVYSVNTSTADIGIMLAFGVIGYVLNLLTIPTAPLVLGLVIGRMLEAKMRQSFALSDSGLLIFLERPISATILIIAAAAFFVPPLYDAFKGFMRRRIE